MIYTDITYKVVFYADSRNGKKPVQEYLDDIDAGTRAKAVKYIEYLRAHDGILDEPYSRHISGKIRELRVDYARMRHRIFYFTFINRNIILLHAFLKKSKKTPPAEIQKAMRNFRDVIDHRETYEE